MTKFEIWLANLNPTKGSEVGKIRPVIILQANYLNQYLNSTIICPISSRPWPSKTNHIKLDSLSLGLEKDSVLLLDQIRALDKSRLIQKLGEVPSEYHKVINRNLKIVLDLD